MRVLISGGGTGGHIYPALAVATQLRNDYQADILYLGSDDGLEMRLIPEAGLPGRGPLGLCSACCRPCPRPSAWAIGFKAFSLDLVGRWSSVAPVLVPSILPTRRRPFCSGRFQISDLLHCDKVNRLVRKRQGNGAAGRIKSDMQSLRDNDLAAVIKTNLERAKRISPIQLADVFNRQWHVLVDPARFLRTCFGIERMNTKSYDSAGLGQFTGRSRNHGTGAICH